MNIFRIKLLIIFLFYKIYAKCITNFKFDSHAKIFPIKLNEIPFADGTTFGYLLNEWNIASGDIKINLWIFIGDRNARIILKYSVAWRGKTFYIFFLLYEIRILYERGGSTCTVWYYALFRTSHVGIWWRLKIFQSFL